TSIGGGALGASPASFIVSASLTSATEGQVIDVPGSLQDIGHRDVDVESHLTGEQNAVVADADQVISNFYYTFPKGQTQPYGNKSGGQPALNEMTAEMERRFREVFAILGTSFGIDFIEVPDAIQP
ncbi:unnamed protein product, partial [Hapterophycus canaliculatus]